MRVYQQVCNHSKSDLGENGIFVPEPFIITVSRIFETSKGYGWNSVDSGW